jgi:hypothetical protein
MLGLVKPHPSSSVLYRFLRLLESATLFFSVSVLLCAGLFVLGNAQEFLDGSLRMLLNLLVVFSTLGVTSAACYIVALVIWMVRRSRVMIGRFLLACLAAALSLSAALAGGALEALVTPG